MDFLIKPWEHQLKAIEMADTQACNPLADLALFFEMGTGKTGTTINILRKHFGTAKRLKRTLILGPVITVKNWQNEFELHSKIKSFDIIPLSGHGDKRAQALLEGATDPKTETLTRGRIFITNYEAMEMDKLFHLLLEWKPEIIICDESHRLKNPKSVRAKRVTQIADVAQHRYILTGTPILNSAMDIFNQYRILDGGETFGRNFYEFRGRYFEDLNRMMPSQVHFPKWSPRPETYEDLNHKIYRKAVRALKKDCLDLPPLIRQRISIALSPEQKRLYEEMKREYITWIKEYEHSPEPKAVVAQMALTKALRLQQIVSGFAKTETGVEVRIKSNPRLDALSDLLEDLTPSHKVIVWATFHQNYSQVMDLCRGLKIEAVELHGGISTAQKNKSIDYFRQNESCRVIIANQGAAGIGINLVEASYSIFYSRNFSLEHDLQAESRNYRGGSEIHQKVTRIDLVAEETIDALILEALAQKQDIAQQVLDWSERL